ncbi:hypothetical protein [Prosthecobacter sp.]|uniref:hypothetical protein n=1 Tax=Prosthecobacter sp. TaxID=1965333 RepID=UPI0037837039
MGVSITLCVILSLTLYVGWRVYFFSLSNRNTLIEMAHKAEQRNHELESMGISFDAATTGGTAPSTLPKIGAGNNEPLKIAAPISPAPTTATLPPSSTFPPESSIRELPLLETTDEVAQAIALLEQYWKTPEWKDRVAMVANAEKVAPLMKDFYETQGGKDPVPGSMSTKARYQINNTEILYFSYSSSRPTGSLEVAMLRGPQGNFLIDWESLAGYGEMSFHEFRNQRPTKAVLMRGYVRLFEYYNFEFSDSKRYLCIKLMSENGENSVYAYCERGSQLARSIDADLVSTGPSGFKGYTMLVSFPPNAQSNQCVNLEKVLAQRWLNLP